MTVSPAQTTTPPAAGPGDAAPDRPPPRVSRSRLLAWYDADRRRLPWRAEPGGRPDPYRVLLSEFMLQQTTVATVLGYFERFLARFPTLEALAAADPAEVMHAWQGLGYYRRARALHACARAIVAGYGGRVPAGEAELRALPGVGPYTAAALRAIAFDLPAVPVDGNALRVLARIHRVETPLPAARRRLAELARPLIASDRPGDFAQALMELGATVCLPRRPRCDACPWRDACAARAAGVAEALPRRAPKATRPLRRGLAFCLRRDGDGAILFRRRPEGGLLGGLHALPTSPWTEGPLDVAEALRRHAPAPPGDGGGAPPVWRLLPGVVRHAFTHFALEATLAEAQLAGRPAIAGPGEVWCPPDRLDRLALPTVMRKLLRHAGLAAAGAPTGGRRGGA
ncbi:MAG TPA: A/G-specific adenine glycosylase [Geminicoccaceae bacterium]|nr:A/G-specific adenine glycosylase [Geminicoccaceae bacterium]